MQGHKKHQILVACLSLAWLPHIFVALLEYHSLPHRHATTSELVAFYFIGFGATIILCWLGWMAWNSIWRWNFIRKHAFNIMSPDHGLCVGFVILINPDGEHEIVKILNKDMIRVVKFKY